MGKEKILKCVREELSVYNLDIFYSPGQYAKTLRRIDELLKEVGF